MRKLKLFTLALTALFATSVWAETVTFSAAEIAAGTVKSGITPYFGASVTNKNVCKDGDTQIKADVCEVKSAADTTLVNSLVSQAQVLFSSSTKYITKLVVKGAFNSTGTGKKIPALYWKGTTRTDALDGAELVSFDGYDKACDNSYYTFENMPAKTQMAGIFKRVKVDNATTPTKKLNSKGVNYGDGQTFYVESVEVTYENSCTAPTYALSLTSDAAANVYAGDEIHLTINGGNGAPTTLKLDGETYEGTTWNAVAGEHTFTISQAANTINEVLYCAGDAELAFNVAAATPVASVTITGETSAYVGAVLTYTATAANATAYEWYLNDIKQGSDSAKFIYTSAVKGSHSHSKILSSIFE